MKVIDVKLKKDNPSIPTPRYATMGAAGLDVHSNETVTINSREFHPVKTGLFVQIPEGYEIQFRPRSGLAYKHGITVLNSPGTIDSDYRGEIMAILVNHGREAYTVEEGERIGQMVLAPVHKINFIDSDALEDSLRGVGGFGSTGRK